MIRESSATIACLLLCASSTAVGGPADAAATRGCVTKAEYDRVHRGMKLRRVHRIFDTRGQHITTTPTAFWRSYRVCATPLRPWS